MTGVDKGVNMNGSRNSKYELTGAGCHNFKELGSENRNEENSGKWYFNVIARLHG